MKHLIFIGSHLGYPMDRTPLGGGAMVGLQLVRHWVRRKDFQLTAIGSGPEAPVPGARYVRLPLRAPESLVRMSEFGYARFCRDFEQETTEYLQSHQDVYPPEYTVVVLNDISEGPDVVRIARMGYPIVSIWHVDVVDYFNKMYLHHWVAPDRLTRAFDRLDAMHLGWVVPDILRLVFKKQRDTVIHSRRLVVPSARMAEVIGQCYRHCAENPPINGVTEPLNQRIIVVPWGGWEEEIDLKKVEAHVEALRRFYGIGPRTRTLMMLSRIAPEKGIHLILKALRILEKSSDPIAKDICVFVCGEPAFMRGKSYDRRIHAAAKKLNHCRVFFPGYLSPEQKQAYFRLTDLFISPSIHESYGLSIVEALRAGLPVLASDHSGVDEILSPQFSRVVSYNGATRIIPRRIDRRVPQRLAAAMTDLLRDREALKRMGRSAKEAAETMVFATAAETLASAALEMVSIPRSADKKEG